MAWTIYLDDETWQVILGFCTQEVIMSAPIDRDEQIELMKNAKTRIENRVKAWTQDKDVRRIVSQPAPGQNKDTIHTYKSMKLVRSG